MAAASLVAVAIFWKKKTFWSTLSKSVAFNEAARYGLDESATYFCKDSLEEKILPEGMKSCLKEWKISEKNEYTFLRWGNDTICFWYDRGITTEDYSFFMDHIPDLYVRKRSLNKSY